MLLICLEETASFFKLSVLFYMTTRCYIVECGKGKGKLMLLPYVPEDIAMTVGAVEWPASHPDRFILREIASDFHITEVPCCSSRLSTPYALEIKQAIPPDQQTVLF